MFPDRRHDDPPGTRLAGLQESRRWLILLLLSEAWLFAAIVGTANWQHLALGDRILLAIAAVCLIAGWLLSRRVLGLWLVTAAPLCLVGAAALNGQEPTAAKWIAISVSAGHVAYACVLLTRPAIGIISIAASGAALAVIWQRRPTNVVPGAIAVAGGWVALTSLLVSALALWVAWHLLLRRANSEDAALAALTERIASEVETQERSHQWRAAAIRVHERLLSTLRYVLQSPTIDRAGLRSLVAAGDLTTINHVDELGTSLRAATAARIASGIVNLDQSVIDLPVSDEARMAGRAAIIECAQNAVLHGGATRVEVSATRAGQMWQVTVRDNGRGIPPDARPGLGWTTALDEGLSSVGGSWSHARLGDETVVTLMLPDASSTPRFLLTVEGFTQGRVLISVPMMAIGTVAIAYDVMAGFSSRVGIALPLVALMSIASGITVVAIGATRRNLLSALSIAGFAALPFLLAVAVSTGASPVVAAAAVTASGYALIAISVWSRWWQWVPGSVLWTGGTLLLAREAPSDRASIAIALVNCLVIIPVVLAVSAIGTTRFSRAQRVRELEREVARREIIRANAAQVIDRQLSVCVHQAENIVQSIADGAPLDERTRHDLECLEGLIRATIQVDPISTGEFGRAAARLVNSAFSQSIPANVGTLAGSKDATPLPPEALLNAERSIANAKGISVRVFTDGARDYLALELISRSAETASPHSAVSQDVAGPVRIETFRDTDGTEIITLSREISAATHQSG